MIAHKTPETKVVIKNFQKICGLLGAPGSSPSLTFSGLVLVIFIGKEMKKISHQISRKMIIEPVKPNFKLLQALLKCHCSLLDEEIQQDYYGHQF